jgi:hypothetical protein
MEKYMNPPLDKSRIAVLAYQIWESEGRPDGRSTWHWLEAERRLREEMPPSLDSSAADLQGDVARLDGDFNAQPHDPGTLQEARRTATRPLKSRHQPASAAGRTSVHAPSR